MRLPCSLTYIQASKTNHEPLRSLSLVNRDWYDAAVPLLYCNLVIWFIDQSSLEEAVYKITRCDLGRKYLEHARRLDIIATRDLPYSRMKEDQRTFQDVYGMGCNLMHLEDFGLDTAGSFTSQCFARWCDPCLDQIELDPGYYYERDWSPLELLLSRLKKVTELNYAVDNAFPDCLLSAIHEFHPRCQLNIWSCQSLSPDHPPKDRVRSANSADSDTGLFGMALLRSPCISAIKVDYGIVYSPDPGQGSQQEAMIPVLNIPPNLKHIYIVLQQTSVDHVIESNQHWAEFFSSYPASALTSTRTSPVSLTVDKDDHECATLLTTLRRSMDFSPLRCLRLGAFSPIDVKEVSPALSCLDTLSINLDLTPWTPHSEAQYKNMFESLRALRFLGIQGFCSKGTFDSILSRHGSTLQSLIVQKSECHFPFQLNYTGGYYSYPVFDVKDISDIARRAPHLQDLRIQLKRSAKAERELAFYDALGQFPALQNLALDFDCSTTEFPDKKILTRNPVDETLAARIWDRISAHPTSWLLCNLCIVPFGKGSLTPFDFAVFLRRSKSVLVSRTSDNGRTIREVGRAEREVLCKQQWELVNQQITS